ncbi:bifunctional hydroxymethylpyrimidine kinase/phosphomethylpyrimidine kinase (plasmid) [Burkholderia sp. FERM BP-3421]|uniref:bifunctional hydroxymethylpyrimidine kinase/phosphomethylpyrimidine kinase n=1 Tax=Burkholderia sp. FERM BP-3421 TaxID=1494466 RepID=UPI00235F9DED|nr:bifunctional hydroxymethylpyrimidine kinase/phosphomethylpyrimidine kinase [Burkholderia sp. FERM BP-3421]WDD90654.1 bifunctional hydroxymethylpyrimidine kinase/phosphomethylpyrimidine kinase [Burkholderia sp. FERM BP-3421]
MAARATDAESGGDAGRIANVLTIAGTDPTGGAGIQADLKAFSALGAYGMSVITAVVAQNTVGVRGFHALDPAFVADQIDAVFDDVTVHAVKIGMLATAEIVEAVAAALIRHRVGTIVLDPVMVAKSGDRLLSPDAAAALRERLVPIATLITPNLPEAGVLLGRAAPDSLEAMHDALRALHALGPQWVLLKGGHLRGEVSTDLLFVPETTIALDAPRIATLNDHGTGCTLSAAITALLPHHPMQDSVRRAKDYLNGALAEAWRLDVGRGHGPTHHFHALWR